MKRTFTLLTTLLLSVAMYALPKQSTVTISTASNKNFVVYIDNKQYRVTDNAVELNNLSTGYHTLKIYQQQKNGKKNNQSNRINNLQLIYNNSFNVKPQYDIDIMINRFGKVLIDEQYMTNDNDNDRWNDRDDKRNDNDDWKDRDKDKWNDDKWDDSRNHQAMDNRSFLQFKQTINNASFEDTKQSIAKQVISSNYFSSEQVKQILQLFSFENTKLDVAKYAYKYTIDKNNYYSLVDVFSFNSSKTELMQYIRDYK
ncbi:MAG: DUF4476 domain-containing protein [Bacteroidota bacterium]